MGDVIDPTQIIKKSSLSPKLLPSDNSIINVPLNQSLNQLFGWETDTDFNDTNNRLVYTHNY